MTLHYNREPSEQAQRVIDSLRVTVQKTLEHKRRLGQYAVIWRDGEVVRLEPDQPAPDTANTPPR